MQINAPGSSIIQSCLFGVVLLCLVLPRAGADVTSSPQLGNELYQIRELAETKKADSIERLIQLRQQLPTSAAVDDRRLVLSSLIDLYLSDDQRDPARSLITELNELGKNNKDSCSLALAMNYQAMILIDEGKLDDAKKMNAQALQLANTVKSKKLVRKVTEVAATVNSEMGDFNTALRHQLAVMDLLDSNDRHDDLDRINGLIQLGNIYVNLKDPAMALDYFDKGVVIARATGAQHKLARLTLDRGVAFTDMGKNQEAIKAYLETESIARKIADRRNETVAVNNLSDSYYRLGNFAQCLRYAKQTVVLAEGLGSHNLKAFGLTNVGLCHMGLGDVSQGAREVTQGIGMLKKEEAKTDIELILGQLAAAYEKAGMFREAYQAIVEQSGLSTELFKSDRDRAVSEMKAKYDASERQKQIEVLEQKNQVQSAEIKNKSLQRIIAILATVIVAAVAVIVLFLYRKVRQTNRNLEEANLKLAHQSTRDPLTGLFNRRAFHDAMKFRTQLQDRRSGDVSNPPHAFVILDIDHFKRINDSYGHACGDAVLVELSNRLSLVMREKDMLMRWGGEEFLIFLSHIPVAMLPQVVERILNSVGETPVEFDRFVVPVTISAGYISMPLGLDTDIDLNWEKMLNLADSALYMAKTRGRNQAVGIQLIGVNKEDLDELLEGNLENSIKQGRVSIEQIAGPVQNEKVPES